MNWSFFNRIICLSNNDDEYAFASAEFNRVGISPVKFPAVKEIGPHQSFSHSERDILLDFLYSDDNRLLHLEDDVVFRDLTHLPRAIDELPDDWDILYLGANLICAANLFYCGEFDGGNTNAVEFGTSERVLVIVIRETDDAVKERPVHFTRRVSLCL